MATLIARQTQKAQLHLQNSMLVWTSAAGGGPYYGLLGFFRGTPWLGRGGRPCYGLAGFSAALCGLAADHTMVYWDFSAAVEGGVRSGRATARPLLGRR